MDLRNSACFTLPLTAEVNTINESTEILHLSPSVMTEYVGDNVEKKAEFCDRSCEELGSMFTELTGLRIVVNGLTEQLEKVVSIPSLLNCKCLVIPIVLSSLGLTLLVYGNKKKIVLSFRKHPKCFLEMLSENIIIIMHK